MTTTVQPSELAAVLTSAGIAQVDHSTIGRAQYSSDASLFRVPPMVIAYPRDDSEVLAAVAVAREHGVPITSRGAGTSIAGNAVGTGLVLDFTKRFRRAIEVDPQSRTATVTPGVVLDELQRVAAPHGLRFGPDPSTHNRATIGGMIGNNACGSRALGYGRTADNVTQLQVVTGTGERITAGRGQSPDTSSVHRALHTITEANLAVLRTELGRFSRQVSGYSLEHLLPERGFDLAKMLVGTEGTCGIVLQATLRLVAAPRHTILVVLGYPDMAGAADAVPALLPHRPTAIEGIDARIVDVVRSRKGASRIPQLPAGRGWLMVELGGESPEQLRAAAAALSADAGALEHLVVTDPSQATAIWRIREDGAGLSARSMTNQPAHAGWEDSAVPPERLGAYLRDFDALLTEQGLSSMPYGHFGDGCVHARIDFPLDSRGSASYREFLLSAAKLARSYGGSMSGEHGDGRARGELLEIMYSPEAIAAFEAVKNVFDPHNVLNPGVIVNPRPLDADIRVTGARSLTANLGLAYTEDAGDFSRAVHRCTGVGKCIVDNTGSGGVMCPSYLATGAEQDSTRGRARILQEMLNGSIVDKSWRSPEVHEALDLCLSCKGCATDCPTGVDMASYKAEVLYQTYRHRIRPITHYTLGALPRWARLASRMPAAVNRLLAMKPVAALAKLGGGLDRRRELPRFAEVTFRDWFAARSQETDATSGDPVLIWVDTFTDYFSPEVGIAAVAVLEDAGFSVRLTEREVCCGLTWITTGQLDTARRKLRTSLAAIGPALEEGIPIVGLEPSCTAVFRSDALELLGDTAKVNAAATSMYTLAELLAKFRPDWAPPDLSGTAVIAQPHCHQHAVLGWDADAALLARSGAQVQTLGGCCGLAGNFGVERGHYDVSVAVANTALLPALRADTDAVVLADGFSCRTQLVQLARREGIHLAQLLAARSELTNES